MSIGPLKTRESRRTITVPTFLADPIAEHLAMALEGSDVTSEPSSASSTTPSSSALVFPAPGG